MLSSIGLNKEFLDGTLLKSCWLIQAPLGGTVLAIAGRASTEGRVQPLLWMLSNIGTEASLELLDAAKKGDRSATSSPLPWLVVYIAGCLW